MNCAGISSADVGDYEMERSNGEGRRKAPSLSPPTAGTAQAARKAANNIISSVIGQAAANIKADESNMDISNIPPPDTAGGPNAGVQQPDGNTPAPAASSSYKNLRQPTGEQLQVMKKSARYDEIMVQRRIRGDHAALGLGPAAENFECGDFHMEGDNRILKAVVSENRNSLIVCSTSFNSEDWTCVSCETDHTLLPLRAERESWEGGRKLFLLTDQNMPAVLPSKDELCPIVIRIDGGLLREIGTNFLELLGRRTVPEGSVILIGSVSHLMEEGRVGYSKGLVTEYIRFSKAFNNTVHVVPFLPPPLCGTNDSELMRAMLDISSWIVRLQKRDLNEYFGELKIHVLSTGTGDELTELATSRHKMPKAFDAYNDRVFMCHGWDGIRTSLPHMSVRAEKMLISSLMVDLSNSFKWELDTEPDLSREIRTTPANSARSNRAICLIVGGSNANRLVTAIGDMGKTVDTINSSGWSISKASVDAMIPVLQGRVALLEPKAPVILWCLDASAFKALTAEGDLVAITRSQEYRRYHVRGKLMVTPMGLLHPTLQELDRLIAVCGNRQVFILDIVPRFLLTYCCELESHCSNVRGNSDAALDATRKVMDDLASLNARIGDFFSERSVKMLPTGDFLTGMQHSSKEELMDSLYETWFTDPVHGEKLAYSKIAIGILETIDRKLPDSDLRFSLSSRKRGREEDRDTRRSVYRSDRDSPTISSRSDRDPQYSRSNRDHYNSTYWSYPGDYNQQRDKYPRRGGGGGGSGSGGGGAGRNRY